MARTPAPPPVTVAPSHNIYTALVWAALIAGTLALVVFFYRAHVLGIGPM
jgi:hypothetical protein